MDHKSDKYGYLRKSGAIGVSTKAIAVKGSTRGKGALGSQSNESARANKATQEAGESARYERLESKILKGLKGSKAKILRDGHNTKMKKMAKPEYRAKHSVAAAKYDVKQAKKTGGDVGVAKQNLATQKDERKTVFNTMKAARKDIRTSNVKGVKKAARGVLKATKQEAKTRFAGKYKKVQAARQERKKKDSGGGFSGLAGLL